MFKPILQSDGSEKAFIFGDAQKYLKDIMYSNDKKLLNDTEITGMYYINKSFGKDLEKELEMIGFQYKGGDIGWYRSPVEFFFGNNARSIAVWTLMFVFAALLFAVKMMYLKTAMVRRSLGIFRSAMLKETMVDIGILILDSIFMIGVFSLWQGSMNSVFVKSFSLLVIVTLLCLVIVSLIANSLFALNIRLMSATTVLKNKKSPGLISYIWLFGILISVFIFEITASEIIHVSKELSKDADTLQNWKVAKDFATIEWFDVEQDHTKDYQVDSMFMIENGAKNKQFIQGFGKSDWLYSKASDFWDSHGRIERQLADPDYVQRLNKFNIDAKDVKLAEYIQYVNPGIIEKNKKIYPKNEYGSLSASEQSSPVILYVPEKYKQYVNKIKNFINLEWTHESSINISHAPVVIVPNNQKTFLFKHKEGEGELLTNQTEQNKILVQLNFSEFPDDSVLTRCFNGIVFDALVNQNLVKQNLKSAGLENAFSSLSNASQKILMKRKEILTQLTGAIIAFISLSIAQIFVLYQYIKLQIENRAKRITVQNILGRSVVIELIKSLILLLGGILIASGFAYKYCEVQNNIFIIGVILIYFIEIFLLVVIAMRAMKEKRVQILKGDFEIL